MTIKDFRAARRAYKEKLESINLVFGVLTGVIVMLCCIGSGVAGIFIAFMAIVVLLVPYILCKTFIPRKERENYKKAYKACFVDAALAKIFTDYSYKHDAGISRALAQADGMFHTGDVFSSNDYITGKYKDVSFVQADVEIQDEHRDEDGTTYTTVFKGRFLAFEFKKKLDLRLEVVGKRFHNNSFPSRKFKKIKLESGSFNKNFRVYAEDGFEAFYILDPAFMERVEKLGEMHHGKVFLAFSGNRMYVAIYDGKDSLEPPSPRKEIDEKAEIEKVTEEIRLITDIVDNLKIK